MNEKVKRFYDAMTNDEALKLRASKINKQFADKKLDDAEAVDAIIAFAAAEGYSFTKDELNAYGESVKNVAMKAMSEEELAAVVGGAGGEVQTGKCVRCFGHCFCFAGGGGQHHEPDYTCVCVIGGGGGKCSKNYLLACGGVGFIESWQLRK